MANQLRQCTAASNLRCRAMPSLGASLRVALAIILRKANAVHGKCLSGGATHPLTYLLTYSRVQRATRPISRTVSVSPAGSSTSTCGWVRASRTYRPGVSVAGLGSQAIPSSRTVGRGRARIRGGSALTLNSVRVRVRAEGGEPRLYFVPGLHEGAHRRWKRSKYSSVRVLPA